jgi:transposase
VAGQQDKSHRLQALHQAQIPLTLLNPRRARDFDRAKGLLAKPEPLDASVLAELANLLLKSPSLSLVQ